MPVSAGAPPKEISSLSVLPPACRPYPQRSRAGVPRHGLRVAGGRRGGGLWTSPRLPERAGGAARQPLRGVPRPVSLRTGLPSVGRHRTPGRLQSAGSSACSPLAAPRGKCGCGFFAPRLSHQVKGGSCVLSLLPPRLRLRLRFRPLCSRPRPAWRGPGRFLVRSGSRPVFLRAS
jgi:hypothetical protein